MSNIWESVFEVTEFIVTKEKNELEFDAIIAAYEDYIELLDEVADITSLAIDCYEIVEEELEQLKDCCSDECEEIGKCWGLQ
jgi:hypothetical protein